MQATTGATSFICWHLLYMPAISWKGNSCLKVASQPITRNLSNWSGLAAHIFNINTWEGKARKSGTQSHPQLMLEASLDYMWPCRTHKDTSKPSAFTTRIIRKFERKIKVVEKCYGNIPNRSEHLLNLDNVSQVHLLDYSHVFLYM